MGVSGSGDCVSFRLRVQQLVDAELSADQARALGQHADSCPDCSGLRDAELKLREALRLCLPESDECPSPQLRARIVASIHHETVIRLRRCRG